MIQIKNSTLCDSKIVIVIIFIKISHIKNVTNKTDGEPNKQDIFERNGMGKCPVNFHDR